jgi:glycosyltransferase involved in cell wall biosynthesis
MSVAMEASLAHARPAALDGAAPLRVVHLTTSYPRHEGDFAGRFVADLVRGLAGHVDVSVLAPGCYRDFGLAYGAGIVGNLRRRPWLAPLLVVSMILALRRAATRRDLVHAHWLAAGAICVLARRRFVLTLHGSGTAGRFADLELARRHPRLVGWVVRRAEAVIAVSEALADAARRCGGRQVHTIPNGVTVPTTVQAEADPPEILFAGRLSPEKGIEELVAATHGMNLVVAGDGPLRDLVPDALGFVPHEELECLYDRAAVVVLPSYREGLPLCVLEAMAHGRPVVASAVGGIPELVEDGATGFLVEPGDVAGLRAALERLLADSALRRRMGRAGRARIAERCSWDRVTAETLAAYGVPAGRAQTTIPSLQYGASRPAVPRVARARLAAWPARNGRSPSPRATRRRGLR